MRQGRRISVDSESGKGIDPMARDRWKGQSGSTTLGDACAARVRLIVWCNSCGHRAEPDMAAEVAQHGVGMPLLDWARLLGCAQCGAAEADFLVASSHRPLGSDAELGANPHWLSNQERMMLEQLVCGASNKHIARELNISESTVRIHLSALLRKLGVRNRIEAAVWTIQNLQVASR
jgi:DNA-binding CsgD family transcriptional regulator